MTCDPGTLLMTLPVFQLHSNCLPSSSNTVWCHASVSESCTQCGRASITKRVSCEKLLPFELRVPSLRYITELKSLQPALQLSYISPTLRSACPIKNADAGRHEEITKSPLTCPGVCVRMPAGSRPHQLHFSAGFKALLCNLITKSPWTVPVSSTIQPNSSAETHLIIHKHFLSTETDDLVPYEGRHIQRLSVGSRWWWQWQ